MTTRLHKIGDAFSQLLNVALLPNHRDTNPNESISGRAHRCGWTRTERAIDWVFALFGETEHCRKAYEADVMRALDLIDQAAS
jgi:hypothetical protein